MTFSLHQVADALGSSPSALPDPLVTGWSVDTRSLQSGDLFFALRGSQRDGHEFVPEAFARGAVAAVISRADVSGPILVRVPDTLVALQSLARWARQRWGGTVIAVTGSTGKTTTKEIIASLLGHFFPAGKSQGNFNNHIGVPLSILRLPDACKFAVVEMGMNHAGEIRQLASIARPDIGVVTNVGHAHVGFFNSIEEIALAKRELIESLPPGGIAVLNADDPRVIRFREIHPGPVLTFGLSETADVRASDVLVEPGRIRFRLVGGPVFEAPLDGLHGVMNLLAALAVARALDIPPERLVDPVRQLDVPAGRGRRLHHRGITILDDCYNSSPEAAMRMIDLLRAEPAQRRIAVLGEMLELGHASEILHRQVGRHVAACGIDVLIGVRGAARHLVDEAVKSGLSPRAAHFFEDPAEAGDFLREIAQPGDAILFKGSRATHVEIALERFMR